MCTGKHEIHYTFCQENCQDKKNNRLKIHKVLNSIIKAYRKSGLSYNDYGCRKMIFI